MIPLDHELPSDSSESVLRSLSWAGVHTEVWWDQTQGGRWVAVGRLDGVEQRSEGDTLVLALRRLRAQWRAAGVYSDRPLAAEPTWC